MYDYIVSLLKAKVQEKLESAADKSIDSLFNAYDKFKEIKPEFYGLLYIAINCYFVIKLVLGLAIATLTIKFVWLYPIIALYSLGAISILVAIATIYLFYRINHREDKNNV